MPFEPLGLVALPLVFALCSLTSAFGSCSDLFERDSDVSEPLRRTLSGLQKRHFQHEASLVCAPSACQICSLVIHLRVRLIQSQTDDVAVSNFQPPGALFALQFGFIRLWFLTQCSREILASCRDMAMALPRRVRQIS